MRIIAEIDEHGFGLHVHPEHRVVPLEPHMQSQERVSYPNQLDSMQKLLLTFTLN